MLKRRRTAIINKQSVPYGLEKVEYLESSGTEYIDTNLTGTNLSTFGKIAALSGTGGSGAFLYGTTDKHYRITSYAYSTDAWGCHWCLSQPEMTTIWGGMIGNLPHGTIVNCDLDMDKKTVTVTSPSTTKTSVGTITSPYLDGIYNNFRIGWPSTNSKCRFYDLKCKKTGVAIAHFIPTLDKTGTPCMFDKVTRKRFYNSGTGQFKFIRLNGVPSDYTPIEYLESSGNEFITINDVNFVVGDDVDMSSELQITNINGVRRAEGANGVYLFWGILDDNKLYAGCGTARWGTSSVLGDTNWHVFSNRNTASQQGFYVDGNRVYTGTKITSNFTPLALQLWKCHGHSYSFGNRKKWWRLTLNGEVKHNLLPCLDQTGTPCMYDTVTQTPYYNAGTGDFLYPSPTSAVTYSMRRPQAEYAKMTDTGVRRLYHVPVDYDGSIENYASENGYKLLNETESPNEEGKYYSFNWVETDDTLTTEWFEIDPPQEEIIEENLDNSTE